MGPCPQAQALGARPVSGRDLDFFAARGGQRDGLTVQPHAFQMKLDRLPDQLERFGQSCAGRDVRAAGAAICRFRAVSKTARWW